MRPEPQGQKRVGQCPRHLARRPQSRSCDRAVEERGVRTASRFLTGARDSGDAICRDRNQKKEQVRESEGRKARNSALALWAGVGPAGSWIIRVRISGDICGG